MFYTPLSEPFKIFYQTFIEKIALIGRRNELQMIHWFHFYKY
jgi:hypothetical protein